MLTVHNAKKGLFVKTNNWTRDNRYVYFKIVHCSNDNNYCKFTCVLPKQSIIILKNNHIEEFEWEYYLKCLHRYGNNDKLYDNLNFLQKNSLIKNLNTKKEKRGKPKKRSRPIVIDFDYKTYVMNKNTYLKRYYPLQSNFHNINKIPEWLIVNEKEYKRFLIKNKLNLFIYLIHKNTSNIPNELYYLMYKYII